MTTLSNIDIVNELGTNLVVYPFKEENLKGSTYNLTVSKYAWNLKTKERVFDPNKNQIILYSNSTTLIQTEEIVWVSSKICGTYHSKVSLVSLGIGHIGTTLDPEYIGCSLIALHNHSEDNLTLEVGVDTFTSIIFRYLNTPSSISKHNNHAGRTEILQKSGINLTQEASRQFEDNLAQIDPHKLKYQLKESTSYQKIKIEYDKKNKKMWCCLKQRWFYFTTILLVVVQGIFFLKFNSIYDFCKDITYPLIIVLATLSVRQLNCDIRK